MARFVASMLLVLVLSESSILRAWLFISRMVLVFKKDNTNTAAQKAKLAFLPEGSWGNCIRPVPARETGLWPAARHQPPNRCCL